MDNPSPGLEQELRKLAKLVNVSPANFKLALGLPLPPCTATTLAEADALYQAAEDGSEAQAAAYKRMTKLLQEAAIQATTIQEISSLWDKAPTGGSAEQGILDLWINLASNLDELQMVWERLSPYSKAADKVLLKMWDTHRATQKT